MSSPQVVAEKSALDAHTSSYSPPRSPSTNPPLHHSNNPTPSPLPADDDGPLSPFPPASAADEARIIRKLDLRLLPLVFVLYTLSVLDRSNLGNARLAGLPTAIDLSGNHYNLLGTIFYIAYILFQWTLLGWKQFPAHKWCAVAVLFWGTIASVQAATTNYAGLAVCRALLGIAEAMFGPGVPLYLSYFYPREKVGFRHGVFISGAAMANAYGGALAYGISQIRGTLAPWRILFLIEGLPTCVMAVVVWFALPDGVMEARFLTAREKEVALAYVARGQVVDVGGEKGVKGREVWAAFKDPKSWIPAVMYFGCNVSFSSLPLFTPTIISELGSFSRIQSNGLSAPPYVLCFFVIILLTWLSDRYKMRGPFCAGAALIAGVGFIINATTSTTVPRYFSIFLSVQIFASVALLLAWTANIHATESKRSGAYWILNLVGQCGPLLGTNVFPDSEKPFYRKGNWISAAMCLMVFVLSVALSFWLIQENKKLDEEDMSTRVEDDEKTIHHGQIQGQGRRYIW